MDIPDRLRNFIFENIDSVESIETLLYLFERKPECKSALEISKELRSNPGSVSNRLNTLKALGLLQQQAGEVFCYQPVSAELDELVNLFAQEYKLRRHKVFEIVFSPSKQAKPLADAFMMRKDPRKGDKGG